MNLFCWVRGHKWGRYHTSWHGTKGLITNGPYYLKCRRCGLMDFAAFYKQVEDMYAGIKE